MQNNFPYMENTFSCHRCQPSSVNAPACCCYAVSAYRHIGVSAIWHSQLIVHFIYCLWTVYMCLHVYIYMYIRIHIYMPSYTLYMPSVLWRCWLGGRKGIRPVKNMMDGGGRHWLVRMEWCPLPIRIVSVSASVNLPFTIKSRSSLLAPAHPGGPGKRP